MVQIVEKKINDLFNITLSNGDNKPDNLPKGNIPLVSSGSENQGIVGKFDTWTTIYPKYSLTIDMFGNTYMHTYEYQTVSHGRVNILLYKNNKYATTEVGLYLATAINKVTQTGQYGFSNMLSSKKIGPLKIKVPVTPTGELDTGHMTSYVKKIEASYVKKIEAYLAVLGYKSIEDCQLSKHNLDVLGAKPKMGGIKVGKLFNINPTKSLNITNDFLFDNNGKYPVVTNSEVNNGITGYSNYKPTMPANTITFSDTTSERSIFLQTKPFIGYPHVQCLHPVEDHLCWTNKQLLYFMSVFRKASTGKYNYGTKFNREKATNEIVMLPITASGEPDYDFMEDYITAIEKLKVVKIKQYLAQKLLAYQKITG